MKEIFNKDQNATKLRWERTLVSIAQLLGSAAPLTVLKNPGLQKHYHTLHLPFLFLFFSIYLSGCTGLNCDHRTFVAVYRLSVLQHRGSQSQTRDRTCVPWTGSWVLYHWTTRKVPLLFLNLVLTSSSNDKNKSFSFFFSFSGPL